MRQSKPSSFSFLEQIQVLENGKNFLRAYKPSLNPLSFPKRLPRKLPNFHHRFRQASARHRLDSKVLRCGRLRAEDRRIENFHFWHDRLIILKQVFDEAEPSTLSQWWYDRRKRVQWYTFWVAALILALTILFGVIQCVEGGLQTYKAFNP